MISYTTFPGTRMGKDGKEVELLPMLSDGFPRMDIEYKEMLENDEAKNSVAPKKRQAMIAAREGGPVADANPLTATETAAPIAMDEGSDADDAGGD